MRNAVTLKFLFDGNRSTVSRVSLSLCMCVHTSYLNMGASLYTWYGWEDMHSICAL